MAKAVMMVSLIFLAFSCEDEEPSVNEPTESILEIVDATADVSTLKAAIDAAGLRTALAGGPFTVFAPTNAAFEAFALANPGVLEYLLETPEELAKVLTYHVVSGEVKSTDLVAGAVATLNGGSVTIALTNGVSVNDAKVATADVLATNGVIHIIDKVLVPSNLVLPEPEPTQKIMEIVDVTAAVSTLKAAIDAAALRATLDGNGPFTVFAPTNDAFTAFATANPGVLEYLLKTPSELAKVLTYHVVAGSVASTDLTNGDVATVNGENVTVDLTGGVKINDANVTTADILAVNGIIHIIDKVLVPSNLVIPANLDAEGNVKSIAEIAIDTESLSSLVAILSLPGLSDILAAASDDNASLTVFAPTNDAFAAVLTALGLTSINEIPEDVLLDIVKYHIVGAVAISSELEATTYETLNGESVTVDLTSGVKVDNANVVAADIIGSNGVVHVVDAVLLPSLYKGALGTIVEYPLFRKDYTTLIAAVKAASPSILTTLLANGPSDGGLTLFAPTNAAFEAAGITALPDAATLDAVLTYHVIDGTVKAADLPVTAAAAPATVTTLGGDFYLSNRGGEAGVFINGSTQVTATDIERGNGVVHVINQTLLPASMTIAAKATELGFTKLVDALTEAGLAQTFVDPGTFTVFAPTNAAFDALYSLLGVTTPAEIDDATLDAVLKYHVINGARVFSTDLADALAPATLQGATLTINVTANGVSITDNDPESADANVVATNVLATNGVIHAIDAVILPVDVAANN
jgi:transforming growth factor-beta-induced protein